MGELGLLENQNQKKNLQNGIWEQLFSKSNDEEIRGESTWPEGGHAYGT